MNLCAQPTKHHSHADAGYAIVMFLSVTFMAITLVLSAIAVTISEITPTKHQRKSVFTIAAAQGGVEAAVALLRRSYSFVPDQGVIGDPHKLPCKSPDNPLVGSVQGTDGLSYRTYITYFKSDPKGQSKQWRDANKLSCSDGDGPSATPLYAVISSEAAMTGQSEFIDLIGNRAVEQVYTFSRTDKATAGGTISLFSNSDLCWKAVEMPPRSGSRLQLATCNADSADQKFSYRTDYRIVLTETLSPDGTGGMCVDTEGKRDPLWFQPCGPLGWDKTNPTDIGQRWSYDDSGNFQGLNPAGKAFSGRCIAAASKSAGAELVLATCNNTDVTRIQWSPDPTVGAGAAGEASQQLINYHQYGRCLDVTNQNVNWPYLILYPCKQDPNEPVRWNQRWIWDEVGTRQIQTTWNNTYCLTTTQPYGDVTVSRCDTHSQNQKWTMTKDTGNRTTSYQVIDSSGRCLSFGDKSPLSWSKVIVAPCDGSAKQKWNATPEALSGALDSYKETTQD